MLLILTCHLPGNRHKEKLIDLRLVNLKHLYSCDFKESGCLNMCQVTSNLPITLISCTIGHPSTMGQKHDF